MEAGLILFIFIFVLVIGLLIAKMFGLIESVSTPIPNAPDSPYKAYAKKIDDASSLIKSIKNIIKPNMFNFSKG